MVSMLDFRSGAQWFEPSLCRCDVSLDNKLYSTLSVSTQVYKLVPAIVMLGGNPVRWTSFPFRDIPSLFLLQKPELSAGLIGLLARMQTLPSPSLIFGGAKYWREFCV